MGTTKIIPTHLNIDTELNINNARYNCVGVLCHKGDKISHGHYTAYIQNRHGWYHINNVDQKVVKAPIGLPNGEWSETLTPYIVFYQNEEKTLNYKIPNAIGPYYNNSCWIDGVLQILYNLPDIWKNFASDNVFKSDYGMYADCQEGKFTLSENTYTDYEKLL